MIKRSIVASSLFLALTLTGCGMQKGQTEVKYEKGSKMNMSEATKTGDYALYTTTDMTPRVVRRVEQGQHLGFRTMDNGQVEAVAGDYTMTLGSNTQRGYWKYYGNASK